MNEFKFLIRTDVGGKMEIIGGTNSLEYADALLKEVIEVCIYTGDIPASFDVYEKNTDCVRIKKKV